MEKLIVESDSLAAITDLNNLIEDRTYFGDMVFDCKLCRDFFTNLLFRFSRRSANDVAYTFVKVTYSLSIEDLKVLDFLLYSLQNDYY